MSNHIKEKILSLVQKDIYEIERALERNLSPFLNIVDKVGRHIIFAGGKRLRPLLMVLCARICGYNGTKDKDFSVIFEYLHAATLLHDDLVDSAKFRRGKQAAHLVWDPETAVLTGDFLLARSLSIGAMTEKLEIIELIARVTEKMSQGEIFQLHNKMDTSLTTRNYMFIIANKTAALIKGACLTGAILSDAPKQVRVAIGKYGLNLGFAFQIADDLLDYTSDINELGKEPGADIREGKMTLPLIHAIKNADLCDKEKIKKIIVNPKHTKQDFENLLSILDKYESITYARSKAKKYIEKSLKSLEIFKQSETKEALCYIAEYVLTRKS